MNFGGSLDRKHWLRVWVGGVCALTLTASTAMASQSTSGAPSGLPWLSGSNAGSNIAAFASYRGSPLDVTTTWEDDGSWRGTESVWALQDGSLDGFASKLSVAIPMLSSASDSLSACAAGAYDSHFRALGATLKQYNRADSFVRLGWEGNGDWYAWSVGSDPTTWTNCFRREVTALRSVDPVVRIDWNMNKDGRIAAQQMYPGDDYVDVVGVDFYDMYPAYRTQADWDADYQRTQDGGPRGLGTWLAFAQAHGKPMSVPEWGVNNGGGGGGFDNPFYIEKMHEFFVANAGSVAYESYFNSQCPAFCLNPAGVNPLASARYKALWRPSAPTPTPTPVPTPTPTPTPVPTPTPTPTPVPTPTPTPPAAAVSVPFRMDTGSSTSYTSATGVVWQADRYFDAGSGATGSTTVVPRNTSTPAIYMTERWCANGYHLPIANGSYLLQLRFDEINPASGTRVFDVVAENTPLLTGFNIAITAGGSNRALLRTFAVTVRDGSLDITFTRHQNCPSISAIAVLPAS